jgi:acyl carrier protein
MLGRPEFVRAMLDEIMGYFAEGTFKPLPKDVYPITDVSAAFQTMAGARHIRKIVLAITPPAKAARVSAAGPKAAAAGSATADSIRPDEGVEALARIMVAAAAQVVVSPRRLQPILDHMRGQLKASAPAAGGATGAPKPAARKLYPRPALGNAFVAPRTPLESQLTESWQALLGIEQVGTQDNFFELGGDSLISVQVISKVKKEFAVQLASSALYENPTPEEFAKAIEAAKRS